MSATTAESGEVQCPLGCGYRGSEKSVEAHISGRSDDLHSGKIGREFRDQIRSAPTVEMADFSSLGHGDEDEQDDEQDDEEDVEEDDEEDVQGDEEDVEEDVQGDESSEGLGAEAVGAGAVGAAGAASGGLPISKKQAAIGVGAFVTLLLLYLYLRDDEDEQEEQQQEQSMNSDIAEQFGDGGLSH